MSAQYRPYRDEESVDGLEATSWSDNEPGTIQIYEKTTEELPFNSLSKRTLCTQIALLLTVGILGFLLGYFTPIHSSGQFIQSPQEANLPDTLAGDHLTDPIQIIQVDSSIKDKLLEKIDGNNILKLLETFKDTNRIPGSKSDNDFALYVKKSFADFEFDHHTATNYTFKTMLPKKPTVVKLLSKENKTLYSNIENEKYEHDDMRPFLPLSQANETTILTDQVLYVNRGTKEDYAKLINLGLNETEGKVLVIRQTFYQAHDVVINAREVGAKAVLLFPDPDVFGESSPFPRSIQLPGDAGRSQPTAWSNYGDLASFNFSALIEIDPTKLNSDSESALRIPVIPISFNTASKLLRGLSGPLAPKEWNCFDFTLYLGPNYRAENNEDQRDKIEIQFFNQETTISTLTVTGTILGSVEPDRYIVIGSRRDSLNRGLLDSVSGSAVMLEIARVFGLLLKTGWRPRRTIIFNSFGAESLNLIGSSNWLETNQRLLHSRAVAYLNCDLVVTGNHSASIAASPLLYQTLYNATKQVTNPNRHQNASLESVYDAWRAIHQVSKREEFDNKIQRDPELELFSHHDSAEPKLTKEAMASGNSNDGDDDDKLGEPGKIVEEFKSSALVKARPKIRRLDLQSIYSPFFLYAGIPVVDVRYAGFPGTKKNSNLVEDMMPLIGTKYDNLATIQHIDPHLKYHVAVAQMLAEITRDLSDSTFLPFNLLDYGVTLRDSYYHFVAQYGKTFSQSSLELEPLKDVIRKFLIASLKFHEGQEAVGYTSSRHDVSNSDAHRRDLIVLKKAMQVRQLNDQLMLLERAFLDPVNLAVPNLWERKHIILTPNDGQDHKGGFPGLVEWITYLEGNSLDAPEYSIFVDLLKVHYKSVIHTISNAIKIIDADYSLHSP